jgi:hypothetical protein
MPRADRPQTSAARSAALLAIGVGFLGPLAACREERIVSRRGLLSSLPGAQTQIPDERTAHRSELLRTPESGIREVREDDSIVLHAKSVQHLMTHIVTTMQNGEEDLFVDQILSEKTRQEFVVRGYDPADAYRDVVRRQRDVFKLFNVMPFGEYTPGLYLRTTGRNEFRLEIPRSSRGNLKWTGMDVVFERGNYRLRWFVGD